MLSFLFTKTPLIFLVQSFWRDEAYSYLVAKKSILEIISISARDYTPPLYYLILHIWMKVAGNSEIGLRLLSFIFFWCTLYISYLFMVNIFKIRSSRAIFYLLLFLINPVLNYYAFEARMYTLFAFLTALSLYLFYKHQYKAYIFVTFLGLLTHYFMLFVIITQVVYSFLLLRSGKKVQPFLKSLFLIFLLFLPWLIFIFNKQQFGGAFWLNKSTVAKLFYLPASIYTDYNYDFKIYGALLLALSLFITSIIALGVSKMIKKKHKPNEAILFIILSLGTSVTVYLISFIKPIFLPRYLIFTTVGLLLLLVLALEQLKTKLKITLLISLILITLFYNQQQIQNRKKENLKKTVSEIKKVAKDGDLLYVTNELNFHTSQYYFSEDRVFIFGKNYEEIPAYVGKILIPKEKITYELPTYPQKAFILKDDLSYEVQATF